MNLVRNATQAMNGRGKVVIGTRARPGPREEGGTWVELRVTDSGPGMSQKVLKICSSRSTPPKIRGPASVSPSASASSRAPAGPSR